MSTWKLLHTQETDSFPFCVTGGFVSFLSVEFDIYCHLWPTYFKYHTADAVLWLTCWQSWQFALKARTPSSLKVSVYMWKTHTFQAISFFREGSLKKKSFLFISANKHMNSSILCFFVIIAIFCIGDPTEFVFWRESCSERTSLHHSSWFDGFWSAPSWSWYMGSSEPFFLKEGSSKAKL